MSRDFERSSRQVADTEEDEKQEEVKNAIATGDNGEIRIMGRGSNRSNNNEYEYYVVMRPVNRPDGAKIRKVGQTEYEQADQQKLDQLINGRPIREHRNRFSVKFDAFVLVCLIYSSIYLILWNII